MGHPKMIIEEDGEGRGVQQGEEAKQVADDEVLCITTRTAGHEELQLSDAGIMERGRQQDVRGRRDVFQTGVGYSKGCIFQRGAGDCSLAGPD